MEADIGAILGHSVNKISLIVFFLQEKHYLCYPKCEENMLIIRNRYIPVRGFSAINILGILFVRPDTHVTPRLLNHERIHTMQMLEMGIIFFYLWYVTEWLVRLTQRGSAYYQISFEREAYRHERDLTYLHRRRWYAWARSQERQVKK